MQKHFPAETYIKTPRSLQWEQVWRPVVGGQYIVAKPGHYFVIIVREVGPQKIKAAELDPMNLEITETELRKSRLKLYSLVEK